MGIKKENIIINNEKVESMFQKLAERRHENLEMMIEDLFLRVLELRFTPKFQMKKFKVENIYLLIITAILVKMLLNQ